MTPAILEAEAAGIRFRLHEIAAAADGSGEQAAAALGVPPERMFKTLVAKVDDDRLVVAIVPVAARLDLRRLAEAAGAKRARLATPREAERSTGYAPGGISPLGQQRRLSSFLDSSALALRTLFVSAGRRGLELELTPGALALLCQVRVARIARRDTR